VPGLEWSIETPITGFKKIIDLILVDRKRRYHPLLNYFIRTALSAPGESAAERIHFGPDLKRQGNGTTISDRFSFLVLAFALQVQIISQSAMNPS
jgi:hypothetical protein